MAIIFELVVNFGQNAAAAESAAAAARAHPHLPVGRHRVRLRPPVIRQIRRAGRDPYLEFAASPARVSYGIVGERRDRRLQLTAEELSELGQGLYALLSRFDGYDAAFVGWESEHLVDLEELRGEQADVLAAGELAGLVLSDEVHRRLPPTAGFVPFRSGYVWIPYRGESASTLTAG